MYVLIKQCGDDISVVAVSESKNLLRQKLVREAIVPTLHKKAKTAVA